MKGVSLQRAAVVLGVAFSGLFDGILLHQVLQWHHLLSLVPGEPLRDLRVQVFADGVFHVLMYGLAALGLGLLWRRRAELASPGAGRLFGSGLLIGFGLWNVVDVGFFHWILHIHNIRLDVDQPLAWDVGWLALLGLAPLLAGWRAGRSRGGPPLPPLAAAALIAALMLGAGAAPLLGAQDGGRAVVLFRPGMADADVMAAVSAVEGRLVWADASSELLVLKLPAGANPWRLYQHGAIMVGGAGPAGCLARMGNSRAA